MYIVVYRFTPCLSDLETDVGEYNTGPPAARCVSTHVPMAVSPHGQPQSATRPNTAPHCSPQQGQCVHLFGFVLGLLAGHLENWRPTDSF